MILHDILITCIDLESMLCNSECWGIEEGKNKVFLDSGETWVILLLLKGQERVMILSL